MSEQISETCACGAQVQIPVAVSNGNPRTTEYAEAYKQLATWRFSGYEDLLFRANVVSARIKYLDALMTGTIDAITDARDVLYMRMDFAGAR